MKIYFAPLEGITDGIYRQVFNEYFGGTDKFFAPFISPSADFRITRREWRQLLYDSGAPYTVVPQVLVREPGVFVMGLMKLKELGPSAR